MCWRNPRRLTAPPHKPHRDVGTWVPSVAPVYRYPHALTQKAVYLMEGLPLVMHREAHVISSTHTHVHAHTCVHTQGHGAQKVCASALGSSCDPHVLSNAVWASVVCLQSVRKAAASGCEELRQRARSDRGPGSSRAQSRPH